MPNHFVSDKYGNLCQVLIFVCMARHSAVTTSDASAKSIGTSRYFSSKLPFVIFPSQPNRVSAIFPMFAVSKESIVLNNLPCDKVDT